MNLPEYYWFSCLQDMSEERVLNDPTLAYIRGSIELRNEELMLAKIQNYKICAVGLGMTYSRGEFRKCSLFREQTLPASTCGDFAKPRGEERGTEDSLMGRDRNISRVRFSTKRVISRVRGDDDGWMRNEGPRQRENFPGKKKLGSHEALDGKKKGIMEGASSQITRSGETIAKLAALDRRRFWPGVIADPQRVKWMPPSSPSLRGVVTTTKHLRKSAAVLLMCMCPFSDWLPRAAKGGNLLAGLLIGDQPMRAIEVSTERRPNEGGGGISEKARRPTASYGTIPTCESPATRPGIEPGSP
ncbi:hypothetical protein PR048_030830 [Dryococelus australis]|uniref:Uncharacterized protein n=1 Tax=Dryococelus australis TaxID=614101 RepID=A0ABQ9GA15_9NEOP|nr:hypothetical protein PR048_030830 [Dryococelus australis]